MSQRNIFEAGPTQVLPGCPLKAAASVAQGEIVMKETASGYFVHGQIATGLVPGGISTKTVDNTSGASGDLTTDVVYTGHYVEVDNTSGADKVLVTDIGADVYVFDRNSVSRLSAGKSKFGKCVGISPDGKVWVSVQQA